MSVRNLEFLFRPRSVAVIGASDRPQSVGATVFRNLLGGGFDGHILPVNLKRDVVAGMKAYRDVASLPETPDLAVVCTPPQTVPGLITDLGTRGTKAAVVLTAGLAAITDEGGRSVQQAMLDAAKPHLLRVLGPNCLGLLVPGYGLNASFAHASARPDISPLSLSRVHSPPRCWTGPSRETSASRTSSPWATAPTSILAMCSIISQAIKARRPS